MIKKSKKHKGFSLVEILISLALVAIFLPAIGIIFSFALSSSSQGEKFTQAYGFAQEGMETVFSLKSQDPNFWNNVGVGYTVSLSTPPPPFARSVSLDCGLSPDCPCLNGVNPHCSHATVIVSWPENGQNQEVKIEAYVTQH